MEWYVYISDRNSGIGAHNIFDHYRFVQDCKDALKKYGSDKAGFVEEIEKALFYYYWGKYEWETVISEFSSNPKPKELKIDVYDQVMLNRERFAEYVWEHRAEIKSL